MMLRKATKVHVYVQCSKPERTYGHFTPQLETVIIEVSIYTVQALRSRAYPHRLHRAKHLLSTNWTYGDIGFYSGQTSI